MTDRADYIVELVRRQDRDRFVTALFAPVAVRTRLLALYALDLELGRIPQTVSEPMLGQMRLQWWRDTIGRIAAGEPPPAGHPVSEALAPLAREADVDAMMALIAACESELEENAQPDLEGGSSALSKLALGILGVGDAVTHQAARHAAVGLALTRRVRSADDPAAEHARKHIAAARAERKAVDRRAMPVLLWATVAEARLRHPAGPPPVARLTWNAWRGHY